MSFSFFKSKRLYSQARQIIAGGVNGNSRGKEEPVPLFFARGHGSRLWDVDGNEHIDYMMGQGANLFGHSPEELATVLAAQARLGTHWSAQSTLELEVGEGLQHCIPCSERVRFCGSGTEAVMASLRLARAWTGRPLVLKFEGHYHGWSDEGLIGTSGTPESWGSTEAPECFCPSEGVIGSVREHFVVARWNDPEHFRRRMREFKGRIAGVIFEPIALNAGCIDAEPKMLATIREECDRAQALMIADETITGFRYGRGGAQEMYGITPDLTILGKALGAGVQIACLVGKSEQMELIAQRRVTHSGTFNANPLALAAAKWSLDELMRHENPRVELCVIGDSLMTGLRALALEHDLPIAFQGTGCAFNTAMLREGESDEKVRDYRQYILRYDGARWKHLRQCLSREGVRCLPRGLWFLSFAHSQADVELTLERAAKAFGNHRREWHA